MGEGNPSLTFGVHKSAMPALLSIFLRALTKAGVVLIVANEIRGFVLAAPVLYGIYQAGGTMVALWLGFCSLAGIALSVLTPIFVAQKLRRKLITAG
jgi:hypothetical protein